MAQVAGCDMGHGGDCSRSLASLSISSASQGSNERKSGRAAPAEATDPRRRMMGLTDLEAAEQQRGEALIAIQRGEALIAISETTPVVATWP